MLQTPHPRTIRSILALVFLAGTLVSVGACEDEVVQAPPQPAEQAPAPVEEKPAEVAETKKPDEEAKGKGEEYKRPEFPGQARRDPFVFEPPQRRVGEDDEEDDRQKEPLENYNLSSLKLIAIVTGTAVPTAMFTDNSNFGHMAKEGDRIGKDGGRITDIRSNEVEITINAKRTLSSDEELENDDEEIEEVEPVTIIILLSDTEIELPAERDGEDDEDIVDSINQGNDEGESPDPSQ